MSFSRWILWLFVYPEAVLGYCLLLIILLFIVPDLWIYSISGRPKPLKYDKDKEEKS